ncbi:hypothetical protein BEH94_01365 [Candidatus Altiarchaeales archaeon WOR_SM1_SCG]|nr:hypothetical protein BEH94_01365 [Candidatus Altiarchaeales archaeon WOR_SM1_SCG]
MTEEEKVINKLINGAGECKNFYKNFGFTSYDPAMEAEPAIRGVKRFKIVSDIFRNRTDRLDDKVMEISCGLWKLTFIMLLI